MHRPNRCYFGNYGNRPQMSYRHHPYMSNPNFTNESCFPIGYTFSNNFHTPSSQGYSYEENENMGYSLEGSDLLTQSLYTNIPPPPASTDHQTPSNLDVQPSSNLNQHLSGVTFNPENSFNQLQVSVEGLRQVICVNEEPHSNSKADLSIPAEIGPLKKSEYVVVPIKRPLPVILDPSLPPEVAKLMENRLCKLCSVQLNSRIQAKTHYEGKPHAKKLKTSIEQFERQGKVSTSEEVCPKKKRISIEDASQLYCKCCDLSFTSTEHAKQHYMGRNHHRVLNGLVPLKTGYYNKTTGKWQRMPPDPTVSTRMLNMDDSAIDDSIQGKGKFFCDLCGVSATSKDQLDDHMKGIRHKKTSLSSVQTEEKNKTKSTDSILASVTKSDRTKKPKPKDYSIFRTPSGNYYCGPCDLNLNSEAQFAMHVDSKKHKFKKK